MRVELITIAITLASVPLLACTAPVSIVRSNYGLEPHAPGAEAPEWEILTISRADHSNDQTGKVCQPIFNYRSCVGPKVGKPFHDICDTYTRSCPAKKPKGGKTNDGKKGHDDPPASASLLAVDGAEDDDTATGNATSRALPVPVANKQVRTTSLGASRGLLHYLSKRLKGVIHKGDDSDAARASVKDNGSLNVVEASVLYDGGRVTPVSHAGGHGHGHGYDGAAEQPTVVKAHEEEEGEQPRGQAQGADEVEA